MAAVVVLSAVGALAQGTNQAAPAAKAVAPASASAAAPRLSAGAQDVLKLSQANVGEDTIISYVKNSDRNLGSLSAAEVVYLHDQGVSDRVVAAMLNNSKPAPQAVAPVQATPAAPANGQTSTWISETPQTTQASAPTYVQYAQPAPVSTVYVIPDSPRYVNYRPYYYPSYGYSGYYGWGYPSVSLSFGFGGGYRYGGFHGGGFHGGGFHGGHHR